MMHTTTRALIGWGLILSGGLALLFGWGSVGRVLESYFLGVIGVWTLPHSQLENDD